MTYIPHNYTYRYNFLCQFSANPHSIHLQAAYKVLHYLKGTIGLSSSCIQSASILHSDLILKTYTDADWRSCLDTRCSTSGLCMFLGSTLISWKSKKQDVVSHSSAESQYRTMSVAVKGVIWIVNLLGELQAPQPKVFGFLCGFTTAIYIGNNLVFHETC